jgi:hypothetical protein
MIPEVHTCSGYLVITAPNGAYRDNAGALSNALLMAATGLSHQTSRRPGNHRRQVSRPPKRA